ncbi:MAG: CpaF family protein [Rhodobacterales bacterium]|nr:CpaF family protein [Rhodobacterales bacterium]MDX5412932.1 CpaF family protein [Rhodobacterales bacterium]
MAFGRAQRIGAVSVPAAKQPGLVAEPAQADAQTGAEPDSEAEFYALADKVRSALVEIIDAAQLDRLNPPEARSEVAGAIRRILQRRAEPVPNFMADRLVDELVDDILGFGPLEPLLAQDALTDIMVNGPRDVYVESAGRIQKVDIRFRDSQHLLNICQRIVSLVGRRVDESSPICDARLPDGSRVNVIAPPLSLKGPTLTIRKFRKEKLTLDDLVRFGSITPEGADILKIVGGCRCNLIVSGGTGSGKTTLLNCIAGYIDKSERIVTCEDSAELQLQQPHVVPLETRPPNLEGRGEIHMRDLVKNCLRMRPDRIVVGEVRGGEAFDLLQAMNTGHDGSMGTVHANTPREALRRLETMITGAGFALPSRNIREMIVNSIDIVVHAARLRDGRRVITHLTEVIGMEEDTIITQDLYVYKISGEDGKGHVLGKHMGTGITQPKIWERAVYFGQQQKLADALQIANRLAEAPAPPDIGMA